MNTHPLDTTVDATRRGEMRAVARALSRIENDADNAGSLADALYPHTGTAWRIGLTGPPGAGKSTLANRLIEAFRKRDQTVGVIAVDPTSPFSGGALLGDRIRMNRYYDDEGVFVRSLASRGAAGGLSYRADAMADVLDAAGYDIIIVETVGVGQSEVDVRHSVDTTVVVLVPESGDTVQTMKAGLMEIADIFCINKADLPGAEALANDLRSTFKLTSDDSEDTVWEPPIVQTSAAGSDDISDFSAALESHRAFLDESSTWKARRLERLRHRIRRLVTEAWEREFWTPERKAALERALANVSDAGETPHAIADRLLKLEN